MTRYINIIFLLCLLWSCKTSQKNFNKNATLITLNGTTVPAGEFLYVYGKNNFAGDTAFSENDVKEYLELYINFKLKVKEAEEKGIHETEAFKEELEGYRKQLAKPYLTESGVTEELVKEAYERLKTEINAAHILLTVPANATPEDTLRIFNEIVNIRERAFNGEDFSSLAKEFSDDPSAKTNGGDLGYFTALQMVYPFEEAAYQTEEASISEPVKTRFGYHIIKVKDKRPSQGKVKVSHIMVRATQGISPEDSIAARNEIFEIYNQLQQGADWFEMASQYSDGISTKASGGELPWFGTGNMIPEFEAAAFSLEEKGDISEPVKTAYGWHIIKLDDQQGLEPFEELEPTLEMKVSKDSRAELNKVALIQRLKKENNFVEFKDVIEKAIENVDSTLLLGNWSYSSESQLLSEKVFTINEKAFYVKDLYDFISERQSQQENINKEQYVNLLYEDFVNEKLVAYEEAHLEEKYPEYKMLLKEYRDGILLFELMDNKVWSKAVEDTVGLKNFYEENKEDYMWEERVEAVILSTASEEIMDSVRYYADQEYYPVGESFDWDTETILEDENKGILDSLAKRLLEDDHLKVLIDLSDSSLVRKTADYLSNQGVKNEKIITRAHEGDQNSGKIELVTTSKKWLEKYFNSQNPLLLQVEEGIYEKEDLPVLSLSKVTWEAGSYSFPFEGKNYYIIINKVLPTSQKAFNSIRGQVISDYQNHLEDEWVSDLRSRYEVKVSENTFKNILEQLENK